MTNWDKYQDIYLKYFLECSENSYPAHSFLVSKFGSGSNVLFDDTMSVDEKVLYLSKWFAQEYDNYKDFKQGDNLYYCGEFYGKFIGIFGNSFVVDKKDSDPEYYLMHPGIPSVEVIEINKARDMEFTNEEEEILY